MSGDKFFKIVGPLIPCFNKKFACFFWLAFPFQRHPLSTEFNNIVVWVDFHIGFFPFVDFTSHHKPLFCGSSLRSTSTFVIFIHVFDCRFTEFFQRVKVNVRQLFEINANLAHSIFSQIVKKLLIVIVWS